MITRTIFLAALVMLAVPAGVKAQTANTTNNFTTTSAQREAAQQQALTQNQYGRSTARNSGNTSGTLSPSDEDFLTQMPVNNFPGAQSLDRDGDGVADGQQFGYNGIGDPFSGFGQPEKKKIIYKYTPKSSTQLRRTIQDDRIEDGYVQGYMQQTGPKE
jgi:hypothetical protein